MSKIDFEKLFQNKEKVNLRAGWERDEVEPTQEDLTRPFNVGPRNPLTGEYQIFEVIKDSWDYS